MPEETCRRPTRWAYLGNPRLQRALKSCQASQLKALKDVINNTLDAFLRVQWHFPEILAASVGKGVQGTT